METLYFTLGVASVVVTVVAVGTVWAMFKVTKLTSMLRDVEQQFESTHRDIDTVEKTIMNNIQINLRDQDERFDHFERDLNERFNHTYRELDDRFKYVQKDFEDVYKTIDSRVDKLAAKQEKQLIKG